MRRVRLRRAGPLVIVAILVGAWFAVHAGAGSGSPRVTVRVTERDFHIVAPKRVQSGDVVLSVANKGPDDHELVIVRATRGRLPLHADGLTVDEEKLSPRTVFSADPGRPGSVRTFKLHLEPGYYVLLCNMAGHFMAGMRTTLVVR